MDIKILDSWLREYLETTATPVKIAEYLSLCGPSVERIKDFGSDKVFDIEVTTNRIDTASVYGIAREASAILPRFNIPAKLKTIKAIEGQYKFVKKVNYLAARVDSHLCPRFTAVLVKNIKFGESPQIIKDRLESAGVRSLNNIVDISNYIMLELGQPTHVFDYDKIAGATMILRESKKGEKITTLDKKGFVLEDGDIVIEDGEGRLIDLAGVMGGDLSAIDENTKNVLLFVQTYNPAKIRKTSMRLAQRTAAASIFEKGTDTELVTPAILRAIEMFKEIAGGIPEKEILNIYPSPPKAKKISLEMDFIEKRLGVSISKTDISAYLRSLEFETIWKGSTLEIGIPSFRQNDILGKEDILEEIARIYGYHNLPSVIMAGKLPGRVSSPRFAFEEKVKNYLADWGGSEVYTLSLVPEKYAGLNALKLKNPLGTDSEYLRTGLMPSLIAAANLNSVTTESFHLFEVANVYIPRKENLPDERLTLAGIFEGYSYREAKGIIEALLQKLNITAEFISEENKGYAAGKSLTIKSEKEILGYLGYTENSRNIYYEFEVAKLFNLSQKNPTYKEIPKYPSQVEDITLILPERTKVGELTNIFESELRIQKYELTSIYDNNNFTFRIWYQDPTKTLTDIDIEKIRNKILAKLKEKFGIQVKE